MRPRERPPGRVLGWGLASLGVYFAWFYFVAFREVDFRQGRRHSGLLILGLVPFAGPFFALAYAVRELRLLAEDLAALGQPPPVSPMRHTLLFCAGLAPAAALMGLAFAMELGPGWWVAAALAALLAPALTAPMVAGDVQRFWRAVQG